MMGRGNGKDGFIVPLVNFMQTPLYGVKNYHIEIVANAEQQVKDTFKVAYDVMNTQKFKGKFKVTKELITNKDEEALVDFLSKTKTLRDNAVANN